MLRLAIALTSIAVIGEASARSMIVPVLYVALAAAIVVLTLLHCVWARRQFLYWLDAAWLLAFAAMAPAQLPYFALLLFYPASALAIHWGARQATLLTGLGAAVLLSIQVADDLYARDGSMPALMLLLLVVGIAACFVADIAKLGTQLRRRVALIHKFADLSNSRLGRDGLLLQAMTELARQFEASAGLMVVRGSDGGSTIVEWGHGRAHLFPAPRQAATELPEIPDNLVVHLHCRRFPFVPRARYYAIDMKSGRRSRKAYRQAIALAQLLEARYLISVPLLRAGSAWGRVHLGSSTSSFSLADALWLRDFTSRLEAALTNAELLHQMIEDAAAQERSHISRNLHDSAIQPYLGLKFGLEALARQVRSDDPLRADIDRLAALANEEVLALRKLVHSLDGEAGFPDDTLERAIRRHAARFARLFNMEIGVEFHCDEALEDETAAHVFHLVAEGLSNVSRHTEAQKATIRLTNRNGELELQVRNSTGASRPAMFTPRSITERAHELGGSVEVSLHPRETVVKVRLPTRQGGEIHAGRMQGDA